MTSANRSPVVATFQIGLFCSADQPANRVRAGCGVRLPSAGGRGGERGGEGGARAVVARGVRGGGPGHVPVGPDEEGGGGRRGAVRGDDVHPVLPAVPVPGERASLGEVEQDAAGRVQEFRDAGGTCRGGQRQVGRPAAGEGVRIGGACVVAGGERGHQGGQVGPWLLAFGQLAQHL